MKPSTSTTRAALKSLVSTLKSLTSTPPNLPLTPAEKSLATSIHLHLLPPKTSDTNVQDHFSQLLMTLTVPSPSERLKLAAAHFRKGQKQEAESMIKDHQYWLSQVEEGLSPKLTRSLVRAYLATGMPDTQILELGIVKPQHSAISQTQKDKKLAWIPVFVELYKLRPQLAQKLLALQPSTPLTRSLRQLPNSAPLPHSLLNISYATQLQVIVELGHLGLEPSAEALGHQVIIELEEVIKHKKTPNLAVAIVLQKLREKYNVNEPGNRNDKNLDKELIGRVVVE